MTDLNDFRPEVPADWTPELHEVTNLEARLKNPTPFPFGGGRERKDPLTETELDLKIEEEILHHEKMVVKLKLLRSIRAEKKVDQKWWVKALHTIGGDR